MSNKDRKLLADQVYRFCCDAIGAPEHLQIAEHLLGAKKHVVTRAAAFELREALDVYPWAFEQNLDQLRRPDAAEWYEWPMPTRAGHGGGDKAMTGCLVLPHPDIETVITMVTAWVGDKRVARHSYGVGLVDLNDIAVNAYHARNGYSEIADESIERVMAQIGVAVPLGFQDEIAIMFNRSEGAMEGVMRDSTAEIPFVLALLLSKQARGGLVVKQGEHSLIVDQATPSEPTFTEKLSAKLMPKSHLPLRRSVGFLGGVSLRWER
jgi:hypothetical protein